jgi:hypothetical protein
MSDDKSKPPVGYRVVNRGGRSRGPWWDIELDPDGSDPDDRASVVRACHTHREQIAAEARTELLASLADAVRKTGAAVPDGADAVDVITALLERMTALALDRYAAGTNEAYARVARWYEAGCPIDREWATATPHENLRPAYIRAGLPGWEG